jgi:hypothetical protein
MVVENNEVVQLSDFIKPEKNSERWLAKSRVDITQCQHGNVGKFISLCFLCYIIKQI